MIRKYVVLTISSGFLMALGLNCLPNIGFSGSQLLTTFGLGGILGL